MQSIIKNIIILVGLLALGGLGYYLFVIESDQTLDGVDVSSVRQAEIETQDFLRRLRDIERIQLSNDMLSDPVFLSFVEFSEPIASSSVGRDNPFQPAE